MSETTLKSPNESLDDDWFDNFMAGAETPAEREQRFRADMVGQWRGVLERSREDFLNLATEIKDPIEERRWDSVIGDDISGRLPSIFIHRLMKNYAQEHGLRSPTLLFVAPSNEEMSSGSYVDRFKGYRNQQVIGKYLKDRQRRLGKRTLLVTEFIAQRRHISRIINGLPRDTAFDVASLAISSRRAKPGPGSMLYQHNGSRSLGQRIYYAQIGDSGAPEIYTSLARQAVGRVKSPWRPTSYRADGHDPRSVQRIQAMVIDMADQIYDEVFRPKQTQNT